ncbi:unnamed protein product [Bursaphelenchus okinawaensis]|uniref:Uncharacterized protein n=1 Tax=Bursaphelenchus okinawaensis TaxID=465554 RepID=A0A811L5S6_9BILA|nr:unnamed protein product [Bursaphelenchus okinawaensis]CAG9116645.1 unnamed protein product [Bursaphelenchus okinawaensis]
MSELDYTPEDLEKLSVRTADSFHMEDKFNLNLSQRTLHGVESLEEDFSGDSTEMEEAKLDCLKTDKRDLEADISIPSSYTAKELNTPSFISVGELRGGLQQCSRGEMGIREKRPYQSFYHQPDLNPPNQYETFDLQSHDDIVKASQYQAPDMRDYTVCHTHAYWLKVQSLQGNKTEEKEYPHGDSVYCIN